MVLSLIGVGLAAAAIDSVAKQKGKKANPNLDETKFDAECAEYGIATSNNGFTYQRIMNIAARCGVRPNKHGVLPQNGWKHCLKYVSQYVNHPDDIDHFQRDWLVAIEKQLKNKSSKLIREHQDSYDKQYNGYLQNKEHWTSGPKIVLEFRHWHGLPKDQYLKRLNDLQTKTFWGELALKPPILRHNPRIEDAFIETWVMQGSKNDRQDSWLTKNKKKTLYKNCLAVCGYDAML